MAKDAIHPVTVAGVLKVTLDHWHQGIEVCVDGASPVWCTTDPNFAPQAGNTPTLTANIDESEWIGANSSTVLANRAIPPAQGAGFTDNTVVWVYCATAGVQLHVHGR